MSQSEESSLSIYVNDTVWYDLQSWNHFMGITGAQSQRLKRAIFIAMTVLLFDSLPFFIARGRGGYKLQNLVESNASSEKFCNLAMHVCSPGHKGCSVLGAEHWSRQSRSPSEFCTELIFICSRFQYFVSCWCMLKHTRQPKEEIHP